MDVVPYTMYKKTSDLEADGFPNAGPIFWEPSFEMNVGPKSKSRSQVVIKLKDAPWIAISYLWKDDILS